MQANKYFPFFLAIALSLSLSCINIGQADDATVTKVCSKVTDQTKSLCNQTLSSLGNSCGPDDLKCKGIIVNKLAINATTYLKAVAKNSSIKSCASHCGSAIAYLKQCNDYWKNKSVWSKTSPGNTTSKMNKSNLVTYAGGADTFLDTCDDESLGKSVNFTVASDQAKGLINVELAIANLLATF
ncbi:hypothetical protein PHJA_002591400 [Phtheirospermum japonicum]|uniref:Pectinesterase inhibitor domain-containing protein n=1 Tax=Phtheirospermum japonicum TaxID=374723 RepID=A0A830D7H6_9LAMI|nr:hypothetical protein PHJA_002591400 [Phtheirospermum japonicum]